MKQIEVMRTKTVQYSLNLMTLENVAISIRTTEREGWAVRQIIQLREHDIFVVYEDNR